MSSYSAGVLDHFQSPRNAGRLTEPDRVGMFGESGKPPYLVLQLRVIRGVVREARFQTYGCGVVIACGSAFTELITGQALDRCALITAGDIERVLGGLPPDKAWCANLPVSAFRAAMKDPS